MRSFIRRKSSSASAMSTPTHTPTPTPAPQPTPSADLTGAAKLEEVTRLMSKLKADLQEINLLPHQRDVHLDQVKVYGRDPTNADPIFTKEASRNLFPTVGGIETLTRHAFNSPSQTTSRNALRCLANAMLLKAETRQIFVDLGYMSKACNKLKLDSREDEFLVSRIVFLTTYDTNINIEKLIDEDHLAETICSNINRHAKQFSPKPKKPKEPMEDMALTETLKLLFNITHFCPQRSGAFTQALLPILVILSRWTIPITKPLDPPVSPLINALMNINFESTENISTFFPKSTPSIYIDRLIELLDQSTKVYTDDELEQSVSPLVTLLRKLYEIAPDETKERMRKSILPSAVDRQTPLGRAETLASRLLRLSTNPGTPQLRECTSSLQFDMSDKDARSFVHNVGYGFAAGFLFQHNVPIPENALEAWSTSGSDTSGARASQDSHALDGKVNLITGQFLDMEEKVEIDMTEEEKEREAERLFVLFERLKKTGVMNVQNPMETAVQEGRFEELPDDADSD